MVKSTNQPSLSAFALDFSGSVMGRCSLGELKAAYESKTGIRKSGEAWRKALRRLEKQGMISVERREQLYMVPNRDKANPSSNGKVPIPTPQPLHSSHRYRFSIAYEGTQPKDGKIRAWGRTGKQIQVEFEFKEGMKVQAFKNRLIIMLTNPKGTTTQEQLIEARKTAYMAILGFCKERNLKLLGDLEKKLGSHHVLEPESLNSGIQGAMGQYAPEIKERTGTLLFGDRSHPGKLEHEGGGTSQLRGEEAAKRFEWFFWRFPDDFANFAGGIGDYNENLKLHLEVQRAQLANMERQTKLFSKMSKTLKRLRI